VIVTDVRNRFVTAANSQDIADRWNGVYPAMREILDTVIRAQRDADRPTADVAQLERIRRELGQLDRGTFKACTRSAGGFSVSSALSGVRVVLSVTSVGDPVAGDIYRLAGALADASSAADRASRAEREVAVPAQPVDGGRHEGADSTQTERGTSR
jgi:hypothetical protein